MKYSKELHERIRQNLRMFDYPRFDDGDIDTLLDEIERLQTEFDAMKEKLLKEFCPNCEAETPCTHEAELYVCDICGEDFAKYIVSRSANVSDVSTTQDVLTSIKTPSSIENTNPDYYKQEIDRLNAERRWIPVSERLPEIHDDYDGEKSDCCYVIDIHKCVWIAYYRPDEKDWYELPAGIILTTITHWMPLPEPPESEGEK